MGSVSQKLIIGRLGSSGRIAIVEHIACYKKGIGLLLFNSLKKPFYKVFMLWQTVVAMEKVSDVPPRCS